jgi:predicted anti-sigma-YlaC factor YlaD
MALGARVVGALDAAERADVDAHLAGCSACREELAKLAPLPAVLGRIEEADALSAGQVRVEPGMVERTLAELRRRRRQRQFRWRMAAVAAGVAIAAAGAGAGSAVALHLSGPATHTGVTAQVSGTGVVGGARASAVLLAEPWGTSIDLTVSGVTPGEHCQLVARSTTGAEEVAGSWEVSYAGQASIDGATSFVPAQLSSLRIVTLSGVELVDIPLPAAIWHPAG